MSTDQVSTAAIDALPLGRLAIALADTGAWLVGGATRSIFGAEPLAGDDIDIAVEGDLETILAQLRGQGFEPRRHERFGTASVEGEDGVRVDLAQARSERYERPGALPTVERSSIDEDLARRDFSINAIAISLDPPHRVLDPFAGRLDLREGILRVLHRRSFADDPTRAIRAARYAARLRLRLDPGTDALIRSTDFSSISADRRDAELRRLAREPEPAGGFRLLEEWGLLRCSSRDLELIDAVVRESRDRAWEGLDPEERAEAVILASGHGAAESRSRSLAVASERPRSPSAGERLASGLSEAELLLAAAAGAAWIRDYVSRWRKLSLAISGTDLIDAGIPSGPAIGAGLAEARRRLLDGELDGDREGQLRVALEVAGAAG